MKFAIALVNSERGTKDFHAAGDPTPGRGANEFDSREEAEAAIEHLEPAVGFERWEVHYAPLPANRK